MTRIRELVSSIAGGIRAIVVEILVPASPEEAAFLVGAGLLAIAFLWASAATGIAWLATLSVGVPGALYVLMGMGFRFGRRG